MEVWKIVILTLVVYHSIGFVLTLIIGLIRPGYDETFGFYWGIAIVALPIICMIQVVKIIKRIKRKIFACAIVQRLPDKGGEYPKKLCKHKDLKEFEESNAWVLVKRYAKYQETKAGYIEEVPGKGKVIRGYDMEYVSSEEIDEVKNEINCFHCRHCDKDCLDDNEFCYPEMYMYNWDDDPRKKYPKFERKEI